LLKAKEAGRHEVLGMVKKVLDRWRKKKRKFAQSSHYTYNPLAPLIEEYRMPRNHLTSPPAAHLAIGIGVTGHRPNRLTQADAALLRTKMRDVVAIMYYSAQDIFAASGAAFAPGPPTLCVLSPLAESADRIIAQEALGMRFELQCPLPSHHYEYERASATNVPAYIPTGSGQCELDLM
jgi:hypothetical protein